MHRLEDHRDRLARLARVYAQYEAGTIEPGELNALLAVSWRRAPISQAVPGASKRDLVAMFKTAGFVTNQPGYDGPTAPMRVYRGATPAGALGFSWSAHRGYAARFACIAQQREGEGVLLETAVTPSQILGVLFKGKLALEIIVNPLTLRRAKLHGTPAEDDEVIATADECERALRKLREILLPVLEGGMQDSQFTAVDAARVALG